MIRPGFGVLTTLFLLCALGACDDRVQHPPRDSSAADPGSPPHEGASPSGEQSDGEDIERLSSLGYVSGIDPAGASQSMTTHDAKRTAPGLNFFTSGHGPVVVLMDMDGVVLHEWRADFRKLFPEHRNLRNRAEPRRNFWRDAHLLPDGDIIAIWDLFGIFKLNRDSEIVWVVQENAHHDSCLIARQSGRNRSVLSGHIRDGASDLERAPRSPAAGDEFRSKG